MKTMMFALFAAFSIASAALAQDYVALDRTADDYDRVQIQPDGTVRVVDTISRETGVPVTVIQQQRARYGLGYGSLLIANSLAAEVGRPVDEILALRQSGRGWGDIARQYNVNVGNVVGRVKRADVAFTGTNSKRDRMKAEKFVNGHDARDGKLDGTGRGHAKSQRVSHPVKMVGPAFGKEHGHGPGKDNGKGKGNGKGHGKQ